MEFRWGMWQSGGVGIGRTHGGEQKSSVYLRQPGPHSRPLEASLSGLWQSADHLVYGAGLSRV